MPAPWSEKGIKNTTVANDEFMIIDSEDPNLPTKNKRVTLSTVQSVLSTDMDAAGFDITDIGALSSSGTVTFSGGIFNVTLVTGAVKFSSLTFNVVGAVDFDTTLNVDGAVTFQTTLNAKGAVDFDTTLNVDGAVDFQSTLDVVGITTLSTANITTATITTATIESAFIDNLQINFSQTFVDGSIQTRAATPNGMIGFVRTATFENFENVEQGDNDSTGVISIAASIDGLKLFVLGSNQGTTNDRTLFEYDMAIQWEIDSSNPSPNSFLNFNSLNSSPQDFYFRDTGLTLFVIFFNGTIREFKLDEPFDLSSGSTTIIDNVGTGLSSVRSLDFSPDGLRLYAMSTNDNILREFAMTSPWDLNSASATGDTLDLSSIDTNSARLKFRLDGTSITFAGQSNNRVFKVTLTTPWDITTGEISEDENFNPSLSDVSGIWINPEMTKLYIAGPDNEVSQYGLGIRTDGAVIFKMRIRRSGTLTTNANINDQILELGSGVTSVVLSDELVLEKGFILILKDVTSTGTVTVDPSGTVTIDGDTTKTIDANFGVMRLYSDGTNWLTW